MPEAALVNLAILDTPAIRRTPSRQPRARPELILEDAQVWLFAHIITARQVVRAQASRGRYFPITVSRLAALTRDWPLSGGGGSERRRLRNPDRMDLASQLLTVLRPGFDVTVYSLPTDVDPESGEHAVTSALKMLAKWKGERAEHMDGRSRRILVSFHGLSRLRVLDERVKFARRKFGAGEGLSSSRKPRVTSRTIIELATIDLTDAANC